MATRRICEFLDGNKISYRSIRHTCAYTAQEVAELSHIPGRHMAKVVVVWLEGRLAIVVVPATAAVDLAKLHEQTGAAEARVADETDFRERFSDCQVGTVPPFGNLFGIETFLDRQLTVEDEFAFNAGTHRDVIVIRSADYNRLVKPRIVDVAVESRGKKTRRPSDKTAPEVWRSQTSDSSVATESALQLQCGCVVVCHDGAD